jgi:hypothetical protein
MKLTAPALLVPQRPHAVRVGAVIHVVSRGARFWRI